MADSDLLKQAREEGNPIIAGGTVTYVWQGQTAPHFIDDLYGWEEPPAGSAAGRPRPVGALLRSGAGRLSRIRLL